MVHMETTGSAIFGNNNFCDDENSLQGEHADLQHAIRWLVFGFHRGFKSFQINLRTLKLLT